MDKEALVADLSGRFMEKRYHQHRGGHKGEGHGFVLFYLLEHGGTALPGEICQAMGVTTPRVAVILRALEEDGLITRTTVEDDRRKVCVALTKKGRDKAAQKQTRMERFLHQWIDHLSEEDAEALPRILDALEQVCLKDLENLPRRHRRKEYSEQS